MSLTSPEINYPDQVHLVPEQHSKDRDVEQILLPEKWLTPLDKADIFLVYSGEKPATQQSFSTWEDYDPDYSYHSYRLITKGVKQAVKSIGLPFFVLRSDGNTTLIIGNSIQSADKLLKANIKSALNSPEYYKALGLALGYPKTAVEAFARRFDGDDQTVHARAIPELQDDEVKNFIGFRLSSFHWRDEVEQVRKQAEVLRRRAPLLYREVVKPKSEL